MKWYCHQYYTKFKVKQNLYLYLYLSFQFLCSGNNNLLDRQHKVVHYYLKILCCLRKHLVMVMVNLGQISNFYCCGWFVVCWLHVCIASYNFEKTHNHLWAKQNYTPTFCPLFTKYWTLYPLVNQKVSSI